MKYLPRHGKVEVVLPAALNVPPIMQSFSEYADIGKTPHGYLQHAKPAGDTM